MLAIGLMSGTSMDGIDAALLNTDGDYAIQTLGHTSIEYSPSFKTLLKAAEYAVRHAQGNLKIASENFNVKVEHYLTRELHLTPTEIATTLITLSNYLQCNSSQIYLHDVVLHSTQLHALVVKKLLQEVRLQPMQIDVIGYHGQTLFHKPAKKITVQVGDPQYLADQLGIKVISDFRTRDVLAGGQGAPFAPLYHQALAVREKKIPIVVVNCGGIANLTLISDQEHVIGFDTGPGNVLLDRLVKSRTRGQEFCDRDGKYGRHGHVNKEIFTALHEKSLQNNGQNYLAKLPPKSLDYGDIQFIPELDKIPLEDACRTLAAFTADTIVNSLDLLIHAIPHKWVLAGGGFKNPIIYQELQDRLFSRIGENLVISSADQEGWNSKALEAEIFAYLAVRSIQEKPISLPEITGVPHPMTGGQTYCPCE